MTAAPAAPPRGPAGDPSPAGPRPFECPGLAEAEGFEPPVGCPTAVFKTAAFGRSATPPEVRVPVGGGAGEGRGAEVQKEKVAASTALVPGRFWPEPCTR